MINAEEHLPMVNKISCDLFKQFHTKYEWRELFQVGCVGLMKAVNKFDESKGYKFSSYAYMTIKGTILNFIRCDSWYIAKGQRERLKNSYAPDPLDKVIDEKGNTIKNLLPYTEYGFSNVEVKMALNSLPINFRKIIVLRYIKGLREKEIAQILKKPEGTISSWTRKAREMLRKELEA